MNRKTGVVVLAFVVAVLVAVCYFLPPSNEFEEPDPPVYYETTMCALDVDGPEVVSVIETSDFETLRNADAIVLYYTSTEFVDYAETRAFLNERMRAGQAVISMIGPWIFDYGDLSQIEREYVLGMAYSPELNAPFYLSFGFNGWDYDSAMSRIAEWLYEIGYPNMEAPELPVDPDPDDPISEIPDRASDP